MEVMEKQFEDFFIECKKQNFSASELAIICKPLLNQQRWKQTKRLVIFISLLSIIYLLFIDCYHCQWAMSAVARLGLIQILPYWNWIPLYKTSCLIERNDMKPTAVSSLLPMGRYETETENCVLCETIDRIQAVENVTFSYLESNFLERGLPVIVTDSHAPMDLTELLNVMQTQTSNFLDSEPCDLATNIMLKKLFNLEVALQKIRTGNIMSKWFLQLRNCQFHAVKDSRLFVTRPYYYPLHLEPFYTSWLLISHNYVIQERRLYLQGLIFVQQLSGRFTYQLLPKSPCNESCPILTIHLSAGECLLFSTDLWIFHYGFASSNENITSIATVLEIDWHF